jgi:hypothetical protein
MRRGLRVLGVVLLALAVPISAAHAEKFVVELVPIKKETPKEFYSEMVTGAKAEVRLLVNGCSESEPSLTSTGVIELDKMVLDEAIFSKTIEGKCEPLAGDTLPGENIVVTWRSTKVVYNETTKEEEEQLTHKIEVKVKGALKYHQKLPKCTWQVNEWRANSEDVFGAKKANWPVHATGTLVTEESEGSCESTKKFPAEARMRATAKAAPVDAMFRCELTQINEEEKGIKPPLETC